MSEEGKKPSKIGGIGQQANQYRTIGGPPAQTPEHRQKLAQQNSIPTLPQNDNKTKQESSNTAKQQPTKTQERDKITYYLDPGQFDKLEDMRIAYKKATGTRFNDQEFMRFIVDRLELHLLL